MKQQTKKIGDHLKEIREQLGISQMELSFQTKISQQAISLWERNERIPNIQACIALADYYNISLDELVGRTYIPQPLK